MRTLWVEINKLQCIINLDEVSSLTSSTPDEKTNIHMKNKDTYIVRIPLNAVRLMWYGHLNADEEYNNVNEYRWGHENNSNKP